jgi:branched-chain amino acid transport system substrate-binding protein
MRNAGSSVAVLGGPAMGREVFVKEAGEAAEGVVFPLLWNPMFAPPRSYEFARRFCERFARTPDYAAAHTYDGVRLLVDAVRIAGLNRVRIRDRLRVLSPWHGVTGRIEWDPTGHNERRVELGTIRDGRIMPLAGTGP